MGERSPCDSHAHSIRGEGEGIELEQLHAMVISIVYAELTVWFIAIGFNLLIIA